jgi:hypothetical protein
MIIFTVIIYFGSYGIANWIDIHALAIVSMNVG